MEVYKYAKILGKILLEKTKLNWQSPNNNKLPNIIFDGGRWEVGKNDK